MTTLFSAKSAGAANSPEFRPEPRMANPRPVLIWAVFGVFFVGLMAYLMVAWIVSGDAHERDYGNELVPTYMKVGIRTWEIAMLLGMIGIFYIKVWRESRRAGRLTFDALLILALCSLCWQDLLMNWIQPTFSYNSYFYNLGAWYDHLPGWFGPNGSNVPEPLIGIMPLYPLLFFIGAVAICAMMRFLSNRWPQMGLAAIFFWCCLAALVGDFLFEAMFQLRLGMYSYLSTPEPLTLFYGHHYQWPIAEGVFSAVLCTTFGYLRYCKNDLGETWAERGIGRVKVSEGKQTVIRFFALCGISNVLMIVLYAVPWNVISANGSDVPDDLINRPYLLGGQCGPGTDYACPGPGVPMPKRDSVHLGPGGLQR